MSRYPVSVKGVLLGEHGEVVLLKNERGEWELPGGRLEIGESPQDCVEREISEELGLDAKAGPLLDAWVYEVLPGASVLILTYGCFADNLSDVACSEEHTEVGFFDPDELDEISLPDGYGASVSAWRRLGGIS